MAYPTFLSRVLFLFCLIFSTLTTSCGGQTNSDAFAEVIKVKNVSDINRSIELVLDPYRPSYLRIGETLYFQILNKSTKNIWFPADSNNQVLIFNKETGDWRGVINTVEFQGKGDLIVPKGKGGLSDSFTIVKPELEKDGKAIKIRVVVTGNIVENGAATDEAVSAYLDLVIQP